MQQLALRLAVKSRSRRHSPVSSPGHTNFIRMAAISGSNIKLVGTHVGVSIGEDGPSQMGLEDIAMMAAQPGVTVLYPSDATSTYRLVEMAAAHKGMVYIRAGRRSVRCSTGPMKDSISADRKSFARARRMSSRLSQQASRSSKP